MGAIEHIPTSSPPALIFFMRLQPPQFENVARGGFLKRTIGYCYLCKWEFFLNRNMILSRQLNFTETIKNDLFFIFVWKNIEHTMNGKTHFKKKVKSSSSFSTSFRKLLYRFHLIMQIHTSPLILVTIRYS